MVQRPKPGPALSATSATSATKYAQLKDDLATEVKTLVQQQVGAASHSSADTEVQTARIRQLEVGFQELKLQGDKFEGWFQKFGAQVSSSNSKLQELAQTVTAQQQELAQVRGEVSRQAEVAEASVHRSVTAMQTKVSNQTRYPLRLLRSMRSWRPCWPRGSVPSDYGPRLPGPTSPDFWSVAFFSLSDFV